ncbi:aat [Symbiodinium natans]|uniref:Aat protein n=1 Tax=Symbiodinium natans TaxID=878477 RepID=A0A812HZ29_9DINO|nr:aat [Symbiodinium natans]
MARIPSSLALEDLEEILPHLVDEGLPGGSEFLVASLDEGERTASLIALLVWHGFLPMSGVGMLLGKMHLQRCVLEPSKTHVGKKVRKRAKAFRLSVNQAWSEVVQNIQRHTWTSAPGDCWLSDKMAQAYKDVQDIGSKWLRGGVRFLSIELWHSETGDLVAGEIGYTCGSVYSSCTGFSIKDKYPGAGCVQLAALGAWLAKRGFKVWDLGMELDYKLELGGQVVPRAEWAATIRKLRHEEWTLPTPEGDEANASNLLLSSRVYNLYITFI